MLRVVILDSNKHFTLALNYIIKDACNTEDVEIIIAESSNDLLTKIGETFDTDVIFLDLDIPGENGLSLTKKIRSMNEHVTIIALSFFDEPHVKEQVLESGANMYVIKENITSLVLQEILT